MLTVPPNCASCSATSIGIGGQISLPSRSKCKAKEFCRSHIWAFHPFHFPLKYGLVLSIQLASPSVFAATSDGKTSNSDEAGSARALFTICQMYFELCPI